eukprot:TRINITY_DN8924_c0_g2_i2.p1 TRINITY_DN8924_c0_g2~~TRINITY_DN8924_c0_g2_i2.p1  ORF type:complete len:842 (-),score=87.45 TRINITY_DN8924_c0_g2_i2:130-2571(-)
MQFVFSHWPASLKVRQPYNSAKQFRTRAVTMSSASQQGTHQFTNRLVREESPYLLQHAHNPVDWFPWGSEAIQKAKDENKPIFLSVGYSTCHWCHVMEHESFENEDVAKIMNENFVNIKVDREERPDVDKVYMMYVQFSSGHGGWPMSVFLTPELNPFYGGTYYPLEDMVVGDQIVRPGFKYLLNKVAELWRQQGENIQHRSAESMEQLQTMLNRESNVDELSQSAAGKAMDSCFKGLADSFDSKLGGFGGPPKFPRPCEINLMFRQHLRSKKQPKAQETNGKDPLEMALFSLQKMSQGGMYDHLGGGFHRYSVDEFWHVPHFEKMLYDNPQLAATYLEAFSLTGQVSYAKTVRGILDYLMRDMQNTEKGGLYSAEDADSLDTQQNKKTEGAFYVWEAEQIQQVLSTIDIDIDVDLVRLFNEHYYVKEAGNCTLSKRSAPHNEFVNKNVFYQFQSVEETAADFDLTQEQTERCLAKCREALHSARAKRPRPHLDDKVVTAWNGMAISAFAQASRILKYENPAVLRSFPVEGYRPDEYLQVALSIAHAIKKNLYNEENGMLIRSFCKGPSQVSGFADDYAYMIQGLLDLYECSGELKWLQWAEQLQTKMQELFWDEQGGGYFSSSRGDSTILMRMKEDYDGAEPAPSSIAASNLWRLGGLFASDDYSDSGLKTIAAFERRLEQAALAMPQMCCAMYLTYSGPSQQVIVCGKLSDDKTQKLIDSVHAKLCPRKVVIIIDSSSETSIEFWKQRNQKAFEMGMTAYQKQGEAVACVCKDYSCQAPTSDPVKVMDILAEVNLVKTDLGKIDLGKLMQK